MKLFTILFSLLFISLTTYAETVSTTTTTNLCKSVIFSEQEIVCLYKGTGIFSLDERIQKIQNTLKLVAEDAASSIDQIKITTEQDHKVISLQDRILLQLSPSDLSPTALTADDFENSTKLVEANIQKSIMKFRQLRAPQKLMTSLLLTLAATLGLVLLLALISKLHTLGRGLINKSHGTVIKTVQFQGYELLNSRRIVRVLSSLNSFARLGLILICFYIYIPLVFSFYPQTAHWTSLIFNYILAPLKTIARVAIDFIPNLFFIAIIIVITNYILKFIKFVFDEIASGELVFEDFHREWADPTYKLIRILVVGMGLVMAFPYIPGSSSPAFQGLTVFLGVLVSFGSSSAVSNIVSGIVLTYMRPFKVGDRVKIADTHGDVLEKSLLVTRIHTDKNVDVTIPNSMVLSNHIVNYSANIKTDGLVVHTTVTIGYEVSWQKVHAALLKAAQRCQHLDQTKKAFVLQTALNDFTVAYELNAFTRVPNIMPQVYSEMHRHIHDVFNEDNIEIMSPNYVSIRDGNQSTLPAPETK